MQSESLPAKWIALGKETLMYWAHWVPGKFRLVHALYGHIKHRIYSTAWVTTWPAVPLYKQLSQSLPSLPHSSNASVPSSSELSLPGVSESRTSSSFNTAFSPESRRVSLPSSPSASAAAVPPSAATTVTGLCTLTHTPASPSFRFDSATPEAVQRAFSRAKSRDSYRGVCKEYKKPHIHAKLVC